MTCQLLKLELPLNPCNPQHFETYFDTPTLRERYGKTLKSLKKINKCKEHQNSPSTNATSQAPHECCTQAHKASTQRIKTMHQIAFKGYQELV